MRRLLAALVVTGCSDPAPCYDGAATFGDIQAQVFDRSCNKFSVCHGPGAGTSVGELNLCGPDSPACEGDPGNSYDALVGAFASCEHGPRDPDDPSCVPDETVRVVPGDPDASYLWRRLTGDGLGADVERMPYNSPPLCGEALDAIREWIEAGAAN